MKSFMKIAAICLTLFTVSPSFAQVRWGVDLRFGTPPPPRREVIVEPPYADAIWTPGYYNHYGYGYRWFPGYWRRPEYRERWGYGERRDGDRDHRYERDDRRERFDHREGRIR